MLQLGSVYRLGRPTHWCVEMGGGGGLILMLVLTSGVTEGPQTPLENFENFTATVIKVKI